MPIRNVLVEIQGPDPMPESREWVVALCRRLGEYGFRLDKTYEPIPMGDPPRSVVVRGELEDQQRLALSRAPLVLRVDEDARIEPFGQPTASGSDLAF